MKSFSSKQLAIIISLITSAISGLFIGFSFYVDESDKWKFIILLCLSVFVIIYIIVYFFLQRFIIEKITPIYKTIHSFNLSDGVLNDNFDDKDILSIVKDDVVEWIKKKTQEITELKQTEKYRKEFLGNVSHELKTPIFNIQGYILTLLDGGLYDATINKNYLQRTEKSIDRLISIVEDLEAISRHEVGELELKFEIFNIAQLVLEVFDNQEIRASKRNIQLKLNSNTEKQVMVCADKQQIFQVMNNFVSNSIKYGNDNGLTTVSFYDMDKNWLIEVEDNGLGIPENSIPRLFERFYRVDKSRSSEQGGTGLGLAIVKHIIEAHNQSIGVKSQLGKGSSFTFTLMKAKK
ncbi:MAG: ATP-binding protein [Bacteroidota bacterium]